MTQAYAILRGDERHTFGNARDQLFKRERIRRTIYIDREEAQRDVFNYIELFYNPKRRHGYANGRSPIEFENQYFNQQQSVF